ncbi:MAG: hypothetical protein GWP18_07255 [Proteobacteria bacterium]|nr:hypothetical protein [Pseudomonadota bacterium]
MFDLDDQTQTIGDDVSVTETTTIVFDLDDQTDTVTRPVGCDAEPDSPTDLNSEPAQWLAFGEYKRWLDAEGCPVRIDVISNINGAPHCELQDAEFITIGRPLGTSIISLPPNTMNRYVWNANGVIPGMAPGETIDLADLPATALDTGYVQGQDHLWIDEGTESKLYVVNGDTARVLIMDLEAGICA